MLLLLLLLICSGRIQGRRCTKKVDSHSVLNWIAVKVLIVPPQESEVVTMNAVDLYLMKHRFDVTHKGYSFHSESTEYSSQIVGEVWTL